MPAGVGDQVARHNRLGEHHCTRRIAHDHVDRKMAGAIVVERLAEGVPASGARRDVGLDGGRSPLRIGERIEAGVVVGRDMEIAL